MYAKAGVVTEEEDVAILKGFMHREIYLNLE